MKYLKKENKNASEIRFQVYIVFLQESHIDCDAGEDNENTHVGTRK